MIVFAPEAVRDLERIALFWKEQVSESQALLQLDLIRSAIMILERHPEIGRRLPESPLRELIISRGKTGYIALYEYAPAVDLVRVVGVRHQREAGYPSR